MSVSAVSAIVVTYRTPAELAAAVASLHAQTEPPSEVIVIDNGAADGYPLEAPELDGTAVKRPHENLGFGSGCNVGARDARGDALLIMNADVVLTASAVAMLARRLASDPKIAIVGPRILSGGRVQPSARAFPSLWTGLVGRTSLLTRLMERWGRLPAELTPAYGPGGAVDWVSGACMLVRRDAFESAGGFDERYWMYWEDADLCRRLAMDGWRVHFEPEAIVHHATGASGISERTVRAFHESAALFAGTYLARSKAGRRAIEAILRARERLVLRLMRNR